LWRIILLMVGFGIAMTGFTLILTALVAFIGPDVYLRLGADAGSGTLKSSWSPRFEPP
jgi:hypothetical protein